MMRSLNNIIGCYLPCIPLCRSSSLHLISILFLLHLPCLLLSLSFFSSLLLSISNFVGFSSFSRLSSREMFSYLLISISRVIPITLVRFRSRSFILVRFRSRSFVLVHLFSFAFVLVHSFSFVFVLARFTLLFLFSLRFSAPSFGPASSLRAINFTAISQCARTLQAFCYSRLLRVMRRVASSSERFSPILAFVVGVSVSPILAFVVGISIFSVSLPSSSPFAFTASSVK